MPDDPLSLDEVHQLWEDATAAERTLLTFEKATEAADGFQPSQIHPQVAQTLKQPLPTPQPLAQGKGAKANV
jgi:hypothetical protein